MLLALKLFVAPALVVTVTLAVRRWGPAIGGWLSGMPVVAGPVLVFLAVEQGTAFAAQGAHATLTGLIGTVAFTVAYARSSVRLRWPVCLVVGWLTFVAAAWLLYRLEPPLFVSLAGLFAAGVAGRAVLPQTSPSSPSNGGNPAADLVLRVLATVTLVLVLTGIAQRLGPRLSGLVNAFPVLTTIITAFTHAQRGSAATVAFVAGFARAIIGFGLFCFVLALTLERQGILGALIMALAAQSLVSALTLKFARRGLTLPPRPANPFTPQN